MSIDRIADRFANENERREAAQARLGLAAWSGTPAEVAEATAYLEALRVGV